MDVMANLMKARSSISSSLARQKPSKASSLFLPVPQACYPRIYRSMLDDYSLRHDIARPLDMILSFCLLDFVAPFRHLRGRSAALVNMTSFKPTRYLGGTDAIILSTTLLTSNGGVYPEYRSTTRGRAEAAFFTVRLCSVKFHRWPEPAQFYRDRPAAANML